MLGWARSQLDALKQIESSTGVAIWSIVIDDGQPVEQLAQIITGQQPSFTDIGQSQSVPAFNLSQGTAGPVLVERLRREIAAATWIVIYAGGTQCPPALIELMQYVSGQNFHEPRFLIVVDAIDLECASAGLQALVRLGRFIDLTAGRNVEYYRELIANYDISATLKHKLADFHHQVAALDGSRSVPFTTRNLDRAASTVAGLDRTGIFIGLQGVSVADTIDLHYVAGLNPDYDSIHPDVVVGIYRKVFNHDAT